jgi:hypothetical protein
MHSLNRPAIRMLLMRNFLLNAFLLLMLLSPYAIQAQTAADVSRLIEQLVELDSIDLAKNVKFRAGLEPALFAADADESSMTVLANPYEVQGRNQPGAAGWYRVSFTVPEMLGKFKIPAAGYNLGIESNVLGSWEIYSYNNGAPAGAAGAPSVTGFWNQGNMLGNARQHPTAWMSNAPMFSKAGDKITVAILATSAPLGRGSPEGFALRHLRLRFALRHTFSRMPMYGAVTAPGQGTGLHGAREMLSTLKGDELAALQARLKEPLARMNLVFEAAETGQLDNLTNAMKTATQEINAALKKP